MLRQQRANLPSRNRGQQAHVARAHLDGTALVGRRGFRDALLDLVCPQDPSGNVRSEVRVRTKSDIDLAKGLAAFPQHAVDDALVVERRQTSLDELRWPEVTDEVGRSEAHARARWINRALIEVRDRGIRSVPGIGQRDAVARQQALGKIVHERRRPGRQGLKVRRIPDERGADLFRLLEADLAQPRFEAGRDPWRREGLAGDWPAPVTASGEHQVERRAVP